MTQKHKTRSNKSIKGNKHSDDSFSEFFKKKLKQYTMETSSSSSDSNSTISSKSESDEQLVRLSVHVLM